MAPKITSAVAVIWFLHLLRVALAGVFVYAGVLKIWQTQEFAYDVQSYQLTSWTVSILVAVYLPWLEVFTGIALLAKRLYRGGLTASGAMVILFLGAIGSAWWRGLDITCGCFGPEINRTNYPLHVTVDLALLAAVIVLIAAEMRTVRARQ